MKKSLFVSLLLVFCAMSMSSQNNEKDSVIFSPHLVFSYAYQFPGGDLADRFGNNSNIGFGFNIKTKKNFLFGVNSSYLFGSEVFEPGLLQNILTDNGEVLDNVGQQSLIVAQERGYTISLDGGKIFSIIGPNKNSGLMITGGIGFIQHKIRLEHQENEINQLEDEYLKGYDRLTNGLLLKEFFGYYHMSKARIANFYIGFEAMQGFTKNRRDFNFDTQTVDDKDRLDLLYGIRFGWVFHLYQRMPDEYYIY